MGHCKRHTKKSRASLVSAMTRVMTISPFSRDRTINQSAMCTVAQVDIALIAYLSRIVPRLSLRPARDGNRAIAWHLINKWLASPPLRIPTYRALQLAGKPILTPAMGKSETFFTTIASMARTYGARE